MWRRIRPVGGRPVRHKIPLEILIFLVSFYLQGLLILQIFFKILKIFWRPSNNFPFLNCFCLRCRPDLGFNFEIIATLAAMVCGVKWWMEESHPSSSSLLYIGYGISAIIVLLSPIFLRTSMFIINLLFVARVGREKKIQIQTR